MCDSAIATIYFHKSKRNKSDREMTSQDDKL